MNALEILKNSSLLKSAEERGTVERHIASNPDIMDGIPVITGTRIPVYIILDYMAEGMTFDQIIKDYPGLNKEKIQAALKFAELLSSLH